MLRHLLNIILYVLDLINFIWLNLFLQLTLKILLCLLDVVHAIQLSLHQMQVISKQSYFGLWIYIKKTNFYLHFEYFIGFNYSINFEQSEHSLHFLVAWQISRSNFVAGPDFKIAN
jgi:hypothetical protein